MTGTLFSIGHPAAGYVMTGASVLAFYPSPVTVAAGLGLLVAVYLWQRRRMERMAADPAIAPSPVAR